MANQMYGSPGQQQAPPQWASNGPPPTSQPNQPQQQWSPQPPPNGQYQPRPTNQLPGITAAPQGPPAMATLQPNHPDQYRALPPPQTMYPPPYQQPQQMGYPPAQPAPRQRTAIACRYCRRRKIRCSGFEQSEDGRCTNCVRFSQECVFTPVSAQTQAFVPAHTVWRGQNPPPNTQLYGAYGQPLPANSRDQQYPPQQGQQQQPGQYPPPPQGYQQQPMYAQQGQNATGTKRPNDEPHTPTLPPPNPGEQAQMPQQGQYGYTGVSPGVKDEASSIAAANERKEEALRNGFVKDVGVQVEIIKADGKEQVS
ncbi:putative zn(2)-C6 fungal-type DNA-binding domain-containing protein [Septoria linicola]|nr:putative zn(2)-C6 fungal-type DNA-binding domain-containing protein [Septoria linicola]